MKPPDPIPGGEGLSLRFSTCSLLLIDQEWDRQRKSVNTRMSKDIHHPEVASSLGFPVRDDWPSLTFTLACQFVCVRAGTQKKFVSPATVRSAMSILSQYHTYFIGDIHAVYVAMFSLNRRIYMDHGLSP